MALWSNGVFVLLATAAAAARPEIPAEEYEMFGKPDVVSAASVSLELYNKQLYETFQYNFIEVVAAKVQQAEDGMRYSLDVETFLSFQQHWLTPHQRDFGPCHLCHFELLAGRYYSMLLNASCTKPRLYIRDYSLASSIAQYAVDQYNICPRNSFLYSMWWIISSMEQQHVENGCIYSIVFYMMKSKKGLCCDQRLQKLKSLTVEEMNKLINSSQPSEKLLRNPEPSQFLKWEPTVTMPEEQMAPTVISDRLKTPCYFHIFLCSISVWLKSDGVAVLRNICLPNPQPNRNCCKM